MPDRLERYIVVIEFETHAHHFDAGTTYAEGLTVYHAHIEAYRNIGAICLPYPYAPVTDLHNPGEPKPFATIALYTIEDIGQSGGETCPLPDMLEGEWADLPLITDLGGV